MKTIYTIKTLQKLKAAALKSVPNARDVCHLHPRAYCVAKLAACCAVFAVPPGDNEPQIKDSPFVIIQNSSAQLTETGEWHPLAYVVTPGECGSRVIDVDL